MYLSISTHSLLHTIPIAEHQSLVLKKLMQGDFTLHPHELQVLRRGRNSCRKSNRRNPAADQDATALEAYIGYLFIQDRERLHEFLDWLAEHLESV